MSELGTSGLDQWGRRRVALRCMQIRQFSQGPRELNRCVKKKSLSCFSAAEG